MEKLCIIAADNNFVQKGFFLIKINIISSCKIKSLKSRNKKQHIKKNKVTEQVNYIQESKKYKYNKYFTNQTYFHWKSEFKGYHLWIIHLDAKNSVYCMFNLSISLTVSDMSNKNVRKIHNLTFDPIKSYFTQT